jgi:hypothetical protein
MSARGVRALVTLCVAVAAFVAGYLVGRSGAPEPRESAPASRAEPSSESIPARDVERASSRPRHRADTEPAAPSPATESAAAPVDAPAERPAVTVRFVVRDRAGAPLAGATVESDTWGGVELTSSVTISTRPSDADGAITAHVPENEPWPIGVTVRRDGYAESEVLVSLDSARGGAVDVDLDRLVEVIGRCVDRGGQALAGIRVLGQGLFPQTATDAAGRFRLARVAQTGAYVRFFPDGRPLAAARAEVPSASGGVADVGDVLLEAGETLRGRFLDAAGNAIPGAKVMLVSRELEGVVVCGETRTDAEGRFAFEHVGRGTFDLGLVRPGVILDGGDNSDVAYDVHATDEVIVRATRDHYVGVQFVDEDHAIVKFNGGRVTWTALDDTSDRLVWWGLGGGWDHFHIAARPGATYEVRIELDGYEPTTLRATATDARDTHVDAVLRRKVR